MTNNPIRIDSSQVTAPTVEFTEAALSQLKLILEHDHTLENKFMRLLVATKGCDGFSYDIGFTNKMQDDFLVPLLNDSSIQVLMDPFAAYYTRELTVDFIQDFEENIEGFLVINHHQKEFHGKFWSGSPELTPPLLDEQT